jgi:squalene monooxygenase
MPLILDSPPTASTPSDVLESRRRVHHEADVVIIGAGILGCALAVAFSDQGRSVILLERSLRQPDRIVGELLQPGGVAALEELGMADCLEDIDAIKVHGYDVIYHGDEVTIPYPENAASTAKAQSEKKSARPEGRSFHHGRFIQKLRERAMRCANVSVVETTATDLVRCGHTGQVLGVECSTGGNKDYYFAHLTVAADGYASKFRKEVSSRAPVVKSKFWGLELIDADLPMPNHGHVLISDSPPVLLYQIGTHETRALVDIPDNLPSASVQNGGVKNHLRNVVLPSLPASVRPSFEAALDRGALRSMPNSFLPASKNRHAGLVLLGDAMNMRHPLTGGGMTVAFNDALMLSKLLAPDQVPRLEDTKAVLAQLDVFHWKRKNLTSVINILAQALYSLFAANGKIPRRFPPRHTTVSLNTDCRSPTQSTPARVFPLLSKGRAMCRWTSRTVGWNHSPAHGTLLPLLCGCFPLHLGVRHFWQRPVHALPSSRQCWSFVEGMRSAVPVHFLRAAELKYGHLVSTSRRIMGDWA